MQLDYLIRELTRLKDILPPESEVRIGASGWGNHTYELSDIRFTPIEEVYEPVHTCDQLCTCEAYCHDLDCPLCECPGCTDNEPEEVKIYFIEGDQDSYSLPETIDYDELKRRLGE